MTLTGVAQCVSIADIGSYEYTTNLKVMVEKEVVT